MAWTPVPNVKLSDHFTLYDLAETSRSQYLEANRRYSAMKRAELIQLCGLLEHIYSIAPFSISSGIRCPELNAAVGGSKKSQHLLGQAADMVPLGDLSCIEFFRKLIYVADSGRLDFHQLIAEPDVPPFNCVHIGLATGNKDGQIFTLNIDTGRKVWISRGR